MIKSIQLSIVIVNYNSGIYAVSCIDSLFKQVGLSFEIIVIDNASQDNSVDLLQEKFADKIMLIKSDENLGFGRANNLAVSKASGEYLLLLNPDTRIEDEKALSILVEKLIENPKVGLIGPAIDEPRKGKQVLPRYSYPSSRSLRYTTKFKDLPGKISWLLGACLLIKASVFDEINGFDPDYFLYGEDADICLRIRLAGYEIAYCETVRITHVAGVSEFGANTLDKWLRKKRGIFLFFSKHFDRRDTLKLAKMVIIKSQLYLMALNFTALFSCKNNPKSLDKKHRLQATIIAAKEVIKTL